MDEVDVAEYSCEFDSSLRRMICQIENHVSDESDSSLHALLCQVANSESCDSEFWDDLSGKVLDANRVRKARIEEMGEIAKHGVYAKVPIKECWEATGTNPIGTRWVDVNKGDDTNPDYRSRLVAQEINNHKREDLFAATPPLESKKILLSLAVTEGIGHQKGDTSNGMRIDFIDVRRAYFHAPARRPVFVKTAS